MPEKAAHCAIALTLGRQSILYNEKAIMSFANPQSCAEGLATDSGPIDPPLAGKDFKADSHP
jgi:hypothetical protein